MRFTVIPGEFHRVGVRAAGWSGVGLYGHPPSFTHAVEVAETFVSIAH
jgi:hypothetical protein